MADNVRVNTVKLTTKPASTPKGRAFPPPTPPKGRWEAREDTGGKDGDDAGEESKPQKNDHAVPTRACVRQDPVDAAAVPHASLTPFPSICTNVCCTVTA